MRLRRRWSHDVIGRCDDVQWIELGRIGAPFGIRGWMHVDSYTEPPAALLDHAQWTLRVQSGERIAYRLAEGEWRGSQLVARLEGIGERDGAAALTGAVVEVERGSLPALRKRQHYRADLVGLTVQNLDGRELGTIRQFVDAPSGPVMVVKDNEGREHWVLAVPPYLRQVELAQGRVIVDWPCELE